MDLSPHKSTHLLNAIPIVDLQPISYTFFSLDP